MVSCCVSLIQRTIQVSFEHRVFFARNVFQSGHALLREILVSQAKCPKVLVVLDRSLAQAQPGLASEIEGYFASNAASARLVCPPLILDGGEGAKDGWGHVAHIHAQVNQYHIDRHSFIIAVGGGALLDAAGLAAATAHRGVRHIRIPTTTLGQNDSGVGVKNGINFFGKKNFIGTFAPPFAVINDFDLLASLPARDKRAGFAEAVKVALIRDRAFFEELEQLAPALAAFDPPAMERAIRRCAELHVNHISQGGDPFELGSARPLDFGHWAAHKLEQLSDFRLRHGEAVAIGIALDSVYSREAGLLDSASVERILTLLEKLGVYLSAEEFNAVDAEGRLRVLEGLQEFQEHIGGNLAITLLQAIGQGMEVHQMDRGQVGRAIDELRRRPNQP